MWRQERALAIAICLGMPASLLIKMLMCSPPVVKEKVKCTLLSSHEYWLCNDRLQDFYTSIIAH